MPEMGTYCKAYLIEQLREFPGWTENRANLRPEHRLHAAEILYLQENYVVTDGIFIDEHIVFENVTDEWREFCHSTLDFRIPGSVPVNIPKK